jgi:tetratricopeptide (TPR) repeat protein
MSTRRGWKQRLATLSRLWDQGHYDRALAEVESLLQTWPGNAHLHILRASLVQRQEEPKCELKEARRTLQRAVELDPGSPAAAIELGHFLDNVDDDPRSALRAYADGVGTARRLLLDGLIGQAKAYRQLGKKEEFVRCLLEVLQLSQADAGLKRNKAEELGADLVIQSPSGAVYALQAKDPYAKQVQDLLGEVVADRSA